MNTERLPYSYSQFSYLDCWPGPGLLSEGLVDAPEKLVILYTGAVEAFLGSNFLPEFPLTDKAFLVFKKYLPSFLQVDRWKEFQVDQIGDMSLGSHSLIQGEITAQALYFDAETFSLTFQEKDLMLAAAILHDLGELTTGDTTFDHKELGFEEAEAATEMISKAGLTNHQQRQLIEAYLRITTSLHRKHIVGILGQESTFDQEIKWQDLRRLFNLYERYGYLITAILVWPFPISGRIGGLTEEDLVRLQTWNRAELEQALVQEENVSEPTRAAILFKNVVLNQWPHVTQAFKGGVFSARLFFNNALARPVIMNADLLMGLGLNLSLFSE
jgi:hypothetical protein